MTRKLVIFCLLASAALPAMARPGDADDNRAERVRPARSSESSPNRTIRPSRVEQGGERSGGWNRPQRPESSVDRSTPRNWSRDQATSGGERRDPSPANAWRSERRNGDERVIRGADSVADWRARRAERDARNPSQAERNDEFRQRWARDRRASRPNDGVWNERLRERYGTSLPRQGSQPPVRVANDGRDSARRHWRGDWRRDRRYDWSSYRNRNRSIFHLGAYYDPFGWNYQRFNIGWRLWPDYYSSNYWINDPYMYRLPAAYPGTRWIRYHDDALLVDTWSGEVIDVIYNFFW